MADQSERVILEAEETPVLESVGRANTALDSFEKKAESSHAKVIRISKRLSASLLSSLYSFWVSQNAGLTPFAFYNPFDVASGQQIGSNYDPTGNNTQGRVTVAFRGSWAQATDIARTNVQGLELVEVT